MTLILSNEDVDKVLTMPECIEVMEEAYVDWPKARGLPHAFRLLHADGKSGCAL